MCLMVFEGKAWFLRSQFAFERKCLLCECRIAYLKRVLGKLKPQWGNVERRSPSHVSRPLPASSGVKEARQQTSLDFGMEAREILHNQMDYFSFRYSSTAKIVRQVETLHILSCCGIVARSLQVQKFRGDLGGVFEVARIDARPIGR